MSAGLFFREAYGVSGTRVWPVRILAGLCVAGIVLGLALCLMQAPQAQAGKLVVAASGYLERAERGDLRGDSADYLLGLSRESLVKALRVDPYNPEAWRVLASVLQAGGDSAAADALTVAGALDSGPDLAEVAEMRMFRVVYAGYAGPSGLR